jgi:DNA-binding transcriptional ArsR family regulator
MVRTLVPKILGQLSLGNIRFLINNIFMKTNMKSKNFEKQIARLHKVLGSPFRIKLLFALGSGEACVCHLEEKLKRRQAYISQHLMALRDVVILETRRDGKYIFYRVVDEGVFDLIQTAAMIQNIPLEKLPKISDPDAQTNCPCPNCETEVVNEGST